VIDLLDAAQSVERLCRRHRWRFCFIGGLAVQRWGEPRLTEDIDLTVITGFGKEREIVARILKQLPPRTKDALDFALENRVLLVKTKGGVAVDISLGALPFEESVVKRATPYRFRPRVSLLTCSAEDLVVLKAFASRPKDWVDVEGILARQRGKLNWRSIWTELRPLVEFKGEPEILASQRRLRQR
jgi:hypothetical protein